MKTIFQLSISNQVQLLIMLDNVNSTQQITRILISQNRCKAFYKEDFNESHLIKISIFALFFSADRETQCLSKTKHDDIS